MTSDLGVTLRHKFAILPHIPMSTYSANKLTSGDSHFASLVNFSRNFSRIVKISVDKVFATSYNVLLFLCPTPLIGRACIVSFYFEKQNGGESQLVPPKIV